MNDLDVVMQAYAEELVCKTKARARIDADNLMAKLTPAGRCRFREVARTVVDEYNETWRVAKTPMRAVVSA